MAIKRDEVLIRATSWMNFEKIAKCKKPVTKGHMFHLYEIPRKDKVIEPESILVVARSWREVSANEYGIPFGGDANVLELDSNNNCTTL